MKNMANFIDQIESGKNYFNIWVYTSKDLYCQFGAQSNKSRTSQLQEAIEQRLQVIVKMHNVAESGVFLLLPKVHAVVPVIASN